MARTKGAKNKHYKEVSERGTCVTIRLKENLCNWLSKQPNKSRYIQSLILKDMAENGQVNKED